VTGPSQGKFESRAALLKVPDCCLSPRFSLSGQHWVFRFSVSETSLKLWAMDVVRIDWTPLHLMVELLFTSIYIWWLNYSLQLYKSRHFYFC
jgi:hypothetical protein